MWEEVTACLRLIPASSGWGTYKMICCSFVDHHGHAEARPVGTHLLWTLFLWCGSVLTEVTILLRCCGCMQGLVTQLAAKQSGYADVLYLDAKTDTYVEEVSSCNIFIVKGRTIKTPPLQVCARVSRPILLNLGPGRQRVILQGFQPCDVYPWHSSRIQRPGKILRCHG